MKDDHKDFVEVIKDLNEKDLFALLRDMKDAGDKPEFIKLIVEEMKRRKR